MLVKAPAPDCETLLPIWDPNFEALGKPAQKLVDEFDARGDALTAAGIQLKCWSDWKVKQTP